MFYYILNTINHHIFPGYLPLNIRLNIFAFKPTRLFIVVIGIFNN